MGQSGRVSLLDVDARRVVVGQSGRVSLLDVDGRRVVVGQSGRVSLLDVDGQIDVLVSIKSMKWSTDWLALHPFRV